MSSTIKLYYEDSHLYEFDAVVLSCEITEKGYAVVLDRTAFFPEEGGQYADTGKIGEACVSDVQEKDEIFHYTDRPLVPGEKYRCVLDRDIRFRKMQNHSGEHIVSGIIHKHYGYDNIGFHLGEGYITLDFNGELDKAQLEQIEKEANAAVYANVPVRTYFPEPKDLAGIEYRSKLDLTENVRLVEIEGVDMCACCAPHVNYTGEIGIIKLLDCMRHRGGVRITAACGADAFDVISKMQNNAQTISEMLSAKRYEIDSAVKRLLEERDGLKSDMIALGNDCASMLCADGETRCRFFTVMPDASARELLNRLKDSFGGIFGVFIGDDEKGYRYYIGSSNVDLKKNARTVNEKINGRGGGSPLMITGMSAASREKIVSAFNELNS